MEWLELLELIFFGEYAWIGFCILVLLIVSIYSKFRDFVLAGIVIFVFMGFEYLDKIDPSQNTYWLFLLSWVMAVLLLLTYVSGSK